MKEILNLITSYPNFPKKGIIFRDLLGVLQDPNIYKTLIKEMSSNKRIKDCDAIISIDARGFIFGSAIALQTDKPMIVARKPNKLPGDLIQKDYKLEYSSNTLAIQKKALKKYQKFNIVDDVLATGGSAKCVKDMLLEQGKIVTGVSVVLELTALGGRSLLNGQVESQISL